MRQIQGKPQENLIDDLKLGKPMVLVNREQSEDTTTKTTSFNIVIFGKTLDEAFEYYKKVAEYEREKEVPFTSKLEKR